MSAPRLMTVAETSVSRRKATEVLEAEEHEALIDFLADEPEVGELIRGSGGVRTVRWAMPGRGKSGGVRVIYYFHSAEIPSRLLTLFATNERATLSDVEVLAKLVGGFKEELRKRKEKDA